MLSLRFINLEKKGHITIISLERPEKRNAINLDTALELEKAVTSFELDDEAHVLILTGSANVFCAGADLSDTERLSQRVLSENGPLGFTRMNLSKPVIAAISGYCVAGGFEAALWTDIRVADETSVFGFLERRFGVPLVDGGTQRLPLIAGLGRALDLILTGRTIDAKQAYEMGIVNYIVPAGKSLEKAMEVAELISTFPQETLRNDRKSIFAGMSKYLSEGLKIEAEFGKSSIQKNGMDSVRLFQEGKGRSGKPVKID